MSVCKDIITIINSIIIKHRNRIIKKEYCEKYDITYMDIVILRRNVLINWRCLAGGKHQGHHIYNFIYNCIINKKLPENY